MNGAYWGQHLVVNAIGDIEATNTKETIFNFAKELVPAIDMVPYGDPHVEWFGEGDLEGFTMVQLIQTSCITAHFNQDGQYFLDVFSCKTYDERIVKNIADKYFKNSYWDEHNLIRKTPITK